jgi:hypothetical protein
MPARHFPRTSFRFDTCALDDSGPFHGFVRDACECRRDGNLFADAQGLGLQPLFFCYGGPPGDDVIGLDGLIRQVAEARRPSTNEFR